MDLPNAEEINYWKTGKSTPDTWLEKAGGQIEALGGHVLVHSFGHDPSAGTSAYMMLFEIGGDQFKVIWPILPTRHENDEGAAKRQAATLLYHDVKAKCLNATVKGIRRAFFEYLRLPDNQTPPDLAMKDLLSLPRILQGFDMPQIEE